MATQKVYGLSGQVITLQRKSGITDAYPWGYGIQKAKVVGDFIHFLVIEILPHMNPKGFDISKPYRCCISKHDIQSGAMIINGGTI